MLTLPGLFSSFHTEHTDLAGRLLRHDRRSAAQDEIRTEVREAIRVLKMDKGVRSIEVTPPDSLRVKTERDSHIAQALTQAAAEGNDIRLGNHAFTVHRSIRDKMTQWRDVFTDAKRDCRTIRVRPFAPEMVRQIRGEELEELDSMFRRFGKNVISNVADLREQIRDELDRREYAKERRYHDTHFKADDRLSPATKPPSGSSTLVPQTKNEVPLLTQREQRDVTAAPVRKSLWRRVKGLFSF